MVHFCTEINRAFDLKGALPPTNTVHMAAFTEPKDVAELLRAIDSFSGTFTVQSALRLAPLVFVRLGELVRIPVKRATHSNSNPSVTPVQNRHP